VAAPPTVSFLAVSWFGSVDAATSARLQAEAPIRLHGLTMFTFLPDTFHQAVARVARGGLSGPHVAMLAAGVLLLGAHGYWMSRWTGRRLDRDLSSSVGPDRARLLLAAVVGAVALLFVIGIDWLRWFSAVGASWMVVAAFVLLAASRLRPAAECEQRVELSPLLVVSGVYLALLSPLPTAATAHGIVRLALLHR
jgi:hypothetical protein